MRGYEERIVRDLRRQVADRDTTIADLRRSVEVYQFCESQMRDLYEQVKGERNELKQRIADREALDALYVRGMLEAP